MNYRLILTMLGWACYFEAGFLSLPALMAVIFPENEAFGFVLKEYLLTIGICLLVGTLLRLARPKTHTMYAREGLVTVSLCWMLFSLFGAIPFVLTGEIPSYVDALFEIVSGFTTTGSSIVTDIESFTHASLFWRSFSHWIGGMGILVFILAILPTKGNGTSMHLMKAESPGPTVSKLVPRLQNTAFILYAIYFGMTILEVIVLLVSGMTWFDSLILTFGTAGTGGFGHKADSVAGFTPFQQNTITIFMILFGINFNFYYLLLIRRFRQAVGMSEVRTYLLIILAAVSIITFDIFTGHAAGCDSIADSLRHAAFQVGSIITTTGYSTVNFDLWPTLSKTILVLLMFVGACAGSTGGGLKVSRIILLFKSIRNELAYAIHPRSVRTVKVDGHAVDPETMRSVNAYFAVYMVIFATAILIVSLDGFSLESNFTAVAATINNIGPGLSEVGPIYSFANFSDLSKIVMTFCMLAGRLELIPVLILFSPKTWKH